ncbi:MAG: DUF4203 domain-containing protein [Kiritimatiellae bacterium]|nr:DUF4203 domain-containing protein [Kiritimatiellia bacterium]
MPTELLSVMVGIGIPVGLVQCFCGYRIFKIVLGILGFFLFGFVAAFVGYALSGEPIVALVAFLLGGVIGAAFMVVLYFVGIFLLGAFMGMIMAGVLCGLFDASPHPALLLLLALIGGVVAVLFQKLMIILSTAFTGAWGVVTGVAYFVTDRVDPRRMNDVLRTGGTWVYGMLLCWLVLALLGVVVQYRFAPKSPAKDVADRE